MDHPRAGLKYLDADDLDDTTIDFDGLEVVGTDGEKLGTVDGFVLDVNAARPYYVVVNAGGWFTSKYFLVPIGQATFDREGQRFTADLSRDRVKRYPGFDRDEFEEVTDEELNRLDREMVGICAPGETIETAAVYRTPTWWQSSYYRADRDRSAASRTAAASSVAASRAESISGSEMRRDHEEVVAHDQSDADDVSPHLGGRAQPGDVLGIETGGEQTHVGETSEDENKRRREGEKNATKNATRLREDQDRKLR
jgi:hypothetical protein